jgi:hypothetical protein
VRVLVDAFLDPHFKELCQAVSITRFTAATSIAETCTISRVETPFKMRINVQFSRFIKYPLIITVVSNF